MGRIIRNTLTRKKLTFFENKKMKIAFGLLIAAVIADDTAATPDLANDGALPTADAANVNCFTCDVAGTDSATTYGLCNSEGGSVECETDAGVCEFEAIRNWSGEVVRIRTGCKQANACNVATRQNFHANGRAMTSPCKPNPTLFGRRVQMTSPPSICRTCFAKCDTDNCFDPSDIVAAGIPDGAGGYLGAPGNAAGLGNDYAFWMPGALINDQNTRK